MNTVEREVTIPAGMAMLEGALSIPKNTNGIVLFAHGSGSSRSSPRNNYVASVLHESALGTLLIDLLTKEEDRDYERRFDIDLLTQRVMEAVDWLSLNVHAKIGLFGASTGAAAALRAAADRKDIIHAVVSRGGRPDLAGNQCLRLVQVPTLLLVGGLDDVVIDLNSQAYALLNCEKKLTIVPGATHLFEEPGTLEKVAEAAAEWFRRFLF